MDQILLPILYRNVEQGTITMEQFGTIANNYNGIEQINLKDYIFYGDWVKNPSPPDAINILINGNLVFLLKEGDNLKMVDSSGEQRYSKINVEEFDPSKWNSYEKPTRPRVYMVKKKDSSMNLRTPNTPLPNIYEDTFDYFKTKFLDDYHNVNRILILERKGSEKEEILFPIELGYRDYISKIFSFLREPLGICAERVKKVLDENRVQTTDLNTDDPYYLLKWLLIRENLIWIGKLKFPISIKNDIEYLLALRNALCHFNNTFLSSNTPVENEETVKNTFIASENFLIKFGKVLNDPEFKKNIKNIKVLRDRFIEHESFKKKRLQIRQIQTIPIAGSAEGCVADFDSGFGNKINAITICNEKIYTGHENGIVTVYDFESRTLLNKINIQNTITSILENNSFMFIGSERKIIIHRIVDKTLERLDTIMLSSGVVTSLNIKKHYLFAGTSDGELLVFNLRNNNRKIITINATGDEKEQFPIDSIGIYKNYMFTYSRNGIIIKWNISYIPNLLITKVCEVVNKKYSHLIFSNIPYYAFTVQADYSNDDKKKLKIARHIYDIKKNEFYYNNYYLIGKKNLTAYIIKESYILVGYSDGTFEIVTMENTREQVFFPPTFVQ